MRLKLVGEACLAAAGLAVFFYGDFLSHPVVRIAGVVLITLAVVLAAILSSTHDHDGD
jgi:hypothetical protein